MPEEFSLLLPEKLVKDSPEIAALQGTADAPQDWPPPLSLLFDPEVDLCSIMVKSLR